MVSQNLQSDQSTMVSDYHQNHFLSFLENGDSAPQIPIVALSTEGQVPITMQGKGVDQGDKKHLEKAIKDFGKERRSKV